MLKEKTTSNSTTPLFKISVLGDKGTGKTQMVQRITKDNFVFTQKHMMTIGIDIATKVINKDKAEIKLIFNDFAGGLEMINMIGKEAHVFILVFDARNLHTLDNLKNTVAPRIQSSFPSSDVTKPEVFLVANKLDQGVPLPPLDEASKLKIQEILEKLKDFNPKYLEVSVKDNIGIDAFFTALTDSCFAKQEENNKLFKSNLDAYKVKREKSHNEHPIVDTLRAFASLFPGGGYSYNDKMKAIENYNTGTLTEKDKKVLNDGDLGQKYQGSKLSK